MQPYACSDAPEKWCNLIIDTLPKFIGFKHPGILKVASSGRSLNHSSTRFFLIFHQLCHPRKVLLSTDLAVKL